MHTQYPPTVRRGTPLSLPLQRRLEDQKKPGAPPASRGEDGQDPRTGHPRNELRKPENWIWN